MSDTAYQERQRQRIAALEAEIAILAEKAEHWRTEGIADMVNRKSAEQERDRLRADLAASIGGDVVEVLRAEVKRLAKDRKEAVDHWVWERDRMHTRALKAEAERDELRGALRETLIPLAAWKLSDERQRYAEIGDDLRANLCGAHDVVFAALTKGQGGASVSFGGAST